MQEIKEHEKRERGPMEPKAAEPEVEPGLGPMADIAKDLRTKEQAPLSFSSTGASRLVYAKLFVTVPKAIVGGYMDSSTGTRGCRVQGRVPVHHADYDPILGRRVTGNNTLVLSAATYF